MLDMNHTFINCRGGHNGPSTKIVNSYESEITGVPKKWGRVSFFITISNLLHHKKLEHRASVKPCKISKIHNIFLSKVFMLYKVTFFSLNVQIRAKKAKQTLTVYQNI